MAKPFVPNLENAQDDIYSKWGNFDSTVAIICGSGWDGLIRAFQTSKDIEYSLISGMSSPTVEGHKGILSLCELNKKQVLVFQGRRHLYEGEGWDPISFPIHLAYSLGIKKILLTNAAGGINANYNVGDLMILNDHINFMGGNPLIGPIQHPKIPRFPDQSKVYDREIIKEAHEIADQQGIKIREGVYIALSGPAFETPAEIRAFRTLGADAVGMSTVPEAMLAHSYGMKVFALSCISNMAAGMSDEKLSHKDVQDASKLALPKMQNLILNLLTNIL